MTTRLEELATGVKQCSEALRGVLERKHTGRPASDTTVLAAMGRLVVAQADYILEVGDYLQQHCNQGKATEHDLQSTRR